MHLIDLIISGISALLGGYILWVEKRLHSMQSQIEDKINAKDVEHLIDLKQSVIDIRLEELKEDLKEIKQDLKELKNKP